MNKNTSKKVILGVSGGIDSAIALYLLKKQGFDVMGVFLEFDVWKNKKNLLKENACCNEDCFSRARDICDFFNVKCKKINVKKDFQKNVIKYFTNELKQNNTPNPCVMCNRFVKIQKLLDIMKEYKADFVATGHYAKISINKKTKEYELKRPVDKSKDQTYFLSYLTQKQIKYLKFPLASYYKKDIYLMAKKLKLDVFDRVKQSQDFCFVDNKSINDFLIEILGKEKGDILDDKGNVLGRHNGLYFYTLGQRKGIGLSGGPFYVLEKDLSKNILIVTKDKNKMFKKEFYVKNFNLINTLSEKDINSKAPSVQIRYADKKGKCKIKFINSKKIQIVLDKPKVAVTPGQIAVIYIKDQCIGGGIIC